jgi:hypothetical protein
MMDRRNDIARTFGCDYLLHTFALVEISGFIHQLGGILPKQKWMRVRFAQS